MNACLRKCFVACTSTASIEARQEYINELFVTLENIAQDSDCMPLFSIHAHAQLSIEARQEYIKELFMTQFMFHITFVFHVFVYPHFYVTIILTPVCKLPPRYIACTFSSTAYSSFHYSHWNWMVSGSCWLWRGFC